MQLLIRQRRAVADFLRYAKSRPAPASGDVEAEIAEAVERVYGRPGRLAKLGRWFIGRDSITTCCTLFLGYKSIYDTWRGWRAWRTMCK